MNGRAKQELDGIVNDLNSISRELESVALELNLFKGIGAEYCSLKLRRISDKYKVVRNSLIKMK